MRRVRVSELLVDYLIRIVELTRKHEAIELGISPRGSLMLFRAAQALAFIRARDYCTADDIKQLVGPVFAHRLVLNQRYVKGRPDQAQVGQVLKEMLETIEVPL